MTIGSLAIRAYTRQVGRPVDSVTAAVLRLQMAQRAVNAVIEELTESVSADPFGESSQPDFRLQLVELRASVDLAVDELIGALARLREASPPGAREPDPSN